MLGYGLPIALIVGLFLGAQLTFGTLWLSMLMSLALATLVPYGDLRGRPWVMRMADAAVTPRKRRRKRRSGWYKHRFY